MGGVCQSGYHTWLSAEQVELCATLVSASSEADRSDSSSFARCQRQTSELLAATKDHCNEPSILTQHVHYVKIQ